LFAPGKAEAVAPRSPPNEKVSDVLTVWEKNGPLPNPLPGQGEGIRKSRSQGLSRNDLLLESPMHATG